MNVDKNFEIIVKLDIKFSHAKKFLVKEIFLSKVELFLFVEIFFDCLNCLVLEPPLKSSQVNVDTFLHTAIIMCK